MTPTPPPPRLTVDEETPTPREYPEPKCPICFDLGEVLIEHPFQAAAGPGQPAGTPAAAGHADAEVSWTYRCAAPTGPDAAVHRTGSPESSHSRSRTR